ncbi:AhpA/YtjB family protein [Catenovulum sediminis]|uniref:AhpA/YtjB family protein n=1 Tax=Catenovulum sediminis TaxID=1740262 RepID=A0ABV1RLW8_9ALTE|nr:AhpA/YtjB family protein [Catenovulum sediminis]
MEQVQESAKIQKRWIIRKLIQAFSGFALIFIALIFWFRYESEVATSFNKSNYQVAHALADLIAASFPHEYFSDTPEAYHLTSFTDNDWVYDASIYDDKGNVLHKTEAAHSILQTTALEQTEGLQTLAIVKEIFNENGDLLGYLRVTVNTDQLTHYQANFVDITSSTTRFLFFLIALASLFMSRAFFKGED